MYLKNINGDVIFEGYFHTVKRAVEAAVQEHVCLDHVNLRNANLSQASLDGAQMDGACLWGANLSYADMSDVSLKKADCRNMNFQNCCLALTDGSGSDFKGSYFSQTIVTDTNLSNTKFSCPSVFSLNFQDAKTLKDAIYSHRGEVDCDLSAPPIVIYGLPKNIILMKDKVIIGTSLYDAPLQDKIFDSFLQLMNFEKSLQDNHLETTFCNLQKSLAKR